MKKMMGTCTRIAPAILIVFFIYLPNVSAVTFDTHFIGGTAPANAVGGGNLSDIVKTAAHMWESVYLDPVTITLFYGWESTGSAGTHTLIEQGGSPNRELSGTILFNNNGSVSFFLDPTPYSNEEYRQLAEESQDLGGGHINVARVLGDPVGDAAGRIDLLTVALHEIGHALGLSLANVSFIEQSGAGVVFISGDLPYKGSVVPLAYNNAGVVAHFDVNEIAYGSVMAGVNGDERRIPSELDIVTNAQISSFTVLRLYPEQILPSNETGLSGSLGSRGVPDSDDISGSGRPAKVQGDRGIRNNTLRTHTQ